ncbi:MAG: VCBS repeat-containing protein [Planctomycetes bacterium]|nr:VCBS repeat-containing protein [Planctomycetota bacterium]
MNRVLFQVLGVATALGFPDLAQGQGELHVLTSVPGLEGALGWSVSGAGDVDADGYPDLLVGSPAASVSGQHSGLATVYSGYDGSPFLFFPGDTGDDGFGWAVSDVGDVNGDGFADVLAGAPCTFPDTSLGYARIFSGSTGAALQTWFAASLYDMFAASLSGAGDFNNDGFPDVVVGASADDNNGLVDSGSAQVFSLQAGLLYTFDGHGAGDEFGHSVSDAGDMDNDGFVDIIVGAAHDCAGGIGAGSAEVFSGKNGSSLYRFLGVPYGYLGYCVSDAGDVNADGHADVIVNGTHQGAQAQSYAHVYSGKDGSVIHSFGTSAAEGYVGPAVSGAGDVNQDGFSDLLMRVSPPGAAGRSGKDGTELFRVEAEATTDYFGFSLSDADDVNGDGIPEIIVGSPWGTPGSASYAKVISTDCGTITAVGQGCAGSAPTVPMLQIMGCPVPGGSLSLVFYGGAPQPTPLLFLVGPGTTSLPMGGGCSLLVAPPFAPLWVATNFFGAFSMGAKLPMGTALGTLAVQGFVPDAAAPAGLRNTNAVLIDVE